MRVFLNMFAIYLYALSIYNCHFPPPQSLKNKIQQNLCNKNCKYLLFFTQSKLEGGDGIFQNSCVINGKPLDFNKPQVLHYKQGNWTCLFFVAIMKYLRQVNFINKFIQLRVQERALLSLPVALLRPRGKWQEEKCTLAKLKPEIRQGLL